MSGTYTNINSKITITCDKNHEFITSPKNINRGIWCPTCGLAVEEKTKTKISNTLSEYYNTEEGKENKKQAHAKRSETMLKIKLEKRENVTEKICKHINCDIKIAQPIDNFCKKSASADGYQSFCKKCTNRIKMEKRKIK